MARVRVETTGPIGRLTLCRPERRNAFDDAFGEECAAALDALEAATGLRCVVLAAEGPSFMAGGDLRAMSADLAADPRAYVDGKRGRVEAAQSIVRRFRALPVPTVVAVQGAAVGYGLSLMLAADLAIARDDAVLVPGYGRVGLSADGGSTHLLPRIVGERRALEIMLLGRDLTAREALDLGLVSRVVEVSRFEAEVEAVAQRLATGPTAAMVDQRDLVRAAFDHDFADHLERETESMVRLAAGEDHREGLAAMLERRNPRFRGR